jgi:hypothetical protein
MKLNFGLLDHDNHVGGVSIEVDSAISGANATAIYEAVESMAIGTAGNSYLVESTLNDVGSEELPTDKFAQRTTKFRVYFTDNVTGEKGQYFSIPTANLDLLGTNSIFVPLAGTEAAALKTLIDAHGRSKAGNAVTVTKIVQVSTGGQ